MYTVRLLQYDSLGKTGRVELRSERPVGNREVISRGAKWQDAILSERRGAYTRSERDPSDCGRFDSPRVQHFQGQANRLHDRQAMVHKQWNMRCNHI
jgi:hypothetical protein